MKHGMRFTDNVPQIPWYPESRVLNKYLTNRRDLGLVVFFFEWPLEDKHPVNYDPELDRLSRHMRQFWA
jgi:hypothetical protein